MALIWTPSLSTGVKWQDEQHRELFDRINQFLDAVRANKGHEELEKVFRYLEGYVVKHFSQEEVAMDAHNYPEKVHHKAEHSKLVKNFQGIKNTYYANKEAGGILLSSQRLLADWIFEHVGKVDKKLGAFLKEKAEA